MKSRYDVVVIGGGLLGGSLALGLARDDVDVLLLERDQINQHASGRNAGSLHFQLEYRMIERGIEAARRAAEAIPLHLEAARLWQELSASIGPSLGVSQHGGLMLATAVEDVRRLEAKAELEQSWGLDVKVLDSAQAHDLAPYLSDSVLAASFCPTEGKANARTSAPALCRAAVQAGATVLSRAGVTSIERHGSRWRVVAEHEGDAVVVETDAVVLAAGVWCSELAEMMGSYVPVEPVALTMSVTARTAPLTPYLIQHAGARLSLKQSVEGNVLIGGGWPAQVTTLPNGSIDLRGRGQLLADSVAGNAAAAMNAVPAVADLPVLRTWVGTTTLAPDQLPVVGPLPGAPGGFVATGGSAFTLGPVFAELLGELVQGRAPRLDLRSYAADRFSGTAGTTERAAQHA
ncbi:NAD(P)/FAD-dependent oxidoreductase [Aeromicrobium fastidiosum]|uniref:FAD-binding oxidoreductase n=1 Tax=Aeromicrobium fastidiosum TaxID=52699 RepID=A0A641AT53_9ACTN|nr:FAD-dependent oxidoreductase [Aeromicrobium fastidiosum]KAA1380707.1 FAD-binding oxidoreductase [Aeromicrobium fastidiosum]MBP2390321.1 glycine/D-amino acid oxidase-like deaminating enzyme [Aeromicrobium fastidiosum]